jgi:hypothetical protein
VKEGRKEGDGGRKEGDGGRKKGRIVRNDIKHSKERH